MHELSLVEAIARRIEADVAERGLQRVQRVRLAVGPLSGVLPHALDFAWRVRAEQPGPLARAQLCLEPTPVRARCLECGAQRTWEGGARLDFDQARAPDLDLDHCPRCGGGPLELVAGQELLILGYEAI
ncbi:MAG: hydrogenase maturation nickel metallochaperone HypA [Limnochordaceae bacterium]|nr:hydrogenase maturation nickel metallochaperone HypA [Limnochordaceae bacterium]